MKNSTKIKLSRLISLIVVLLVIFGGIVSFKGIGPVDNLKKEMSYGLDINGGSYVVMQADLSHVKAKDKESVMEQTKEVLEKRVDAMGVANSVVTIEGEDRFRIEMPGVDDSNDAIQRVGQTAKLRFTTADNKEYLTGNLVKTATSTMDDKSAGYKIVIDFKKDGQEAFAKATEKAASGSVKPTIHNDGTVDSAVVVKTDSSKDYVDAKSVVIWLDNEIITAPTCDNKIDSNSCEITQPNGMDKEYAENIAALIRGGSLPVELKELTSSTQAATVGADALDTAIIAGAIGLALVFIIMIIFFGFAGFLADIALTLYGLILLWGMAAFDVTLTLPGIAGIILGLGMAVDTNVLIFTRIKDELKIGRPYDLAVVTGTKDATRTVFDSQITTLIAVIILYYLGGVVVKGFSITLMISIVLSLFTGLFITNNFIKAFSGTKFSEKNIFGKPITITKVFPVCSKKKIYLAISVAVLIIGIVCAGFKGLNLGLDFTGGTRIDIDTGKMVSEQQIEKSLDKFNLDEEITYSGSDNSVVVIKTKTPLDAEARDEVIDKVCDDFNLDKADAVQTSEEFEGTIGKETQKSTLLAIIFAWIGMLAYIFIRFRRMRYGFAALSGVFHDVLILLASYAIFSFVMNSSFIACVLTIIGYSVNDTIVLFDRVRTNLSGRGDYALNEKVIDKSISECLSRTVVTSVTTMAAILPLVIMGSGTLRDFTIPLLIGVICGTYSSIFICSPLLSLGLKKKAKSKKALPRPKSEIKEIKSVSFKSEGKEVTHVDASSDNNNSINKNKTKNENPYKNGEIDTDKLREERKERREKAKASQPNKPDSKRNVSKKQKHKKKKKSKKKK